MGLSAYGDLSYQEEFKDLVNINENGSIRLNLKYFDHEKNFYSAFAYCNTHTSANHSYTTD
jgi:predicted NodU family carbamoyl transferase